MYLILFVCAVTFPIVYFNIQPIPSTLLTVMAAGFIVATAGCLLILFGPKTQLLWQGADVDDNFQIVQGGSQDNGLRNLKKKVVQKVEELRSSGSSGSSMTRKGPTMRNKAKPVSPRTTPQTGGQHPTGNKVSASKAVAKGTDDTTTRDTAEQEGKDGKVRDFHTPPVFGNTVPMEYSLPMENNRSSVLGSIAELQSDPNNDVGSVDSDEVEEPPPMMFARGISIKGPLITSITKSLSMTAAGVL